MARQSILTRRTLGRSERGDSDGFAYGVEDSTRQILERVVESEDGKSFVVRDIAADLGEWHTESFQNDSREDLAAEGMAYDAERSLERRGRLAAAIRERFRESAELQRRIKANPNLVDRANREAAA